MIFAVTSALALLSGCDGNDAPADQDTRTSDVSLKTSISATTTAPDFTEPAVTEPIPADVTPPVAAVEDIEITQGDSVSYRAHLTVSDDTDPDPYIEIDNSAVDLDTPGEYPVVYTVTDKSGNSTVVTITLTVKEYVPTFGSEEEEYVYYESRKILEEILDDDMNELQKAYAIYYWSKRKISYSGKSDKSSYLIGAYDGFKNRRGDCFTYYAVAKALLEAAGIENIDMVKLRTSDKQARHYWLLVNVGDGWYHFDSTQFAKNEANFFMVTDEELKAWDKKYYEGAHNYDPEGLPELATESIQKLVNYKSSKLVLAQNGED